MSDTTKIFATKCVSEKEGLIADLLKTYCKEALRDVAIQGRISVDRFLSDGREIWKVDGKPFAETYPPEFETIQDGFEYKMKATWRYRSLA